MYVFHKNLTILTLFILLNKPLFAFMYSNAEDKKITSWHVLKSFAKGKIENIYDTRKKSRVIQLKGQGTKSAYMLMPTKISVLKKSDKKIFSWEMNYHEDFVIMIGMDTIKGKRYLIYTAGQQNSYLQYGLGIESKLGKWKKYSRNLQEDLERFDKFNRILKVNNFVIKGSGKVDNILLLTKNKNKNEIKIKKQFQPIVKVKHIEKNKKCSEKVLHNNKSIAPIIHLNGQNPLVLKKGESYIEAGATATDKRGHALAVSITEDIDIFKEGEYSVIYLARDKQGNSSINRRRIRVGSFSEEKEKIVRKEVVEIEAPEEDDVDYEAREFEMVEWEKELALREKELAQKEQHGVGGAYPPMRNRNYPSSPGGGNYPSRPGL